jgi:arsenate reductase
VTQTATVLFVCHHNANRSQIAAAYLQQLAGDRIQVRSAGPAPADALNPVAVQVMAEDGIDIAGATPIQLTATAVQDADVVITLGCADACPTSPDKRYEDWALPPPAGQGADAARHIRDQLKQRVQALAADLLAG